MKVYFLATILALMHQENHKMKYFTSVLHRGYRVSVVSFAICLSGIVWAENPNQVAEPIAVNASNSMLHSGIDNSNDQQVAALQARLVPFLNEQGIVRYHAAKARAWLSYAVHERSEKSTTVARAEALSQAESIIKGLEHGQAGQLSLTTPISSISSVMRRDLWATAELLKQNEGFSCAQTEIAQAEVMLVWAAAEHSELGWRHSRELFLSAQSLVDQATLKSSACMSRII